MPDAITWYALGRIVGDPESIMEAIDEKLVAHNADVSAHGLTDEAVHTHRTDEALDHPQYSIYNIKLAPSTRTVQAFCDAGGAAEFEDIQEAINYAVNEGGGVVRVKAGTYVLNDQLKLYSGISLIGEGPGLVILDFQTAEKNFRISGTASAGTGTITCGAWPARANTKQVVGTNTLFTSEIEPGDLIDMDGFDYEVASIEDDTHLTLVLTYRGPSFVNVNLYIRDYIQNCNVENITVKNVTGTSSITACGIYCILGRFLTFKNVRVQNCDKSGMVLSTVQSSTLEDCIFADNKENGLLLTKLYETNCINVSCFGNIWYGFSIAGTNDLSGELIGCSAYHNGRDGFYVGFTSWVRILACSGVENGASGFFIHGVDMNTILGCWAFNNNSYGIRILGGSDNIITANQMHSNIRADYNDGGIDTQEAANSYDTGG